MSSSHRVFGHLPPLTTADEFHTRGAHAQVQMGMGWAGNRYHKQHAMLSVPFHLTYFSTRNSSTQVSASDPVLLFHCSCHHARVRRRKRREHGRGVRYWRFTGVLPLMVLLSHLLTEPHKVQSGTFKNCYYDGQSLQIPVYYGMCFILILTAGQNIESGWHGCL